MDLCGEDECHESDMCILICEANSSTKVQHDICVTNRTQGNMSSMRLINDMNFNEFCKASYQQKLSDSFAADLQQYSERDERP